MIMVRMGVAIGLPCPLLKWFRRAPSLNQHLRCAELLAAILVATTRLLPKTRLAWSSPPSPFQKQPPLPKGRWYDYDHPPLLQKRSGYD
jgi:hypothetical protein